jgi:hypothetical protein
MWRNGLHRRHDRVTKKEASWSIRTTTDEEPVHTASLELRMSDYHATKLTLDLADNEEVSISENAEVTPATPVADIITKKRATEPQHIDDPADLLEVQAWTKLHQLKADSGWEGIVIRNGSHVQVEAIVANEERKQQLLNAFAPIRDIGLEVHLLTDGRGSGKIIPNRARPRGKEPGLAEGLEEQFPESGARTRFSNDALHLSQQIFGQAFFIDKLQQRRLTMRRCSCARDLTDLVAIEKAGLSSLQGSLYRSLEPLIGTAPYTFPRPLTLIEAEDLDVAIEDLFSASTGEDESAFNARVQDIRNLL